MKNMLKIFATAGCLLASAVTANANLIVNGSFEDPSFGPSGGWGLYTAIPGWEATGAYPIEIGTAGNYSITGQDGKNVMELDSTGNAIVSQIVTTPGEYVLSFLFAKRGNGPDLVSSFNVMWNNTLWSILPASTHMEWFTATVVANAGVNTLSFEGTGASNTHGALIDNVQLNRVPDGGSTLALLGGVLGLLGIWSRRRS